MKKIDLDAIRFMSVFFVSIGLAATGVFFGVRDLEIIGITGMATLFLEILTK